MGEQDPAKSLSMAHPRGRILRLLSRGQGSPGLLPHNSTSVIFGQDQPLQKLQEQNKN